MGNSVKVRLKEGENQLEVTEALVQEFQNHVNVTDKSMAGFAKSVDCMRTACEMLLRQCDAREHPSQDTVTGKNIKEEDKAKLAQNLLETIDSSVSDYKFVVLESLSKLFNFIVNIGNSYINPTDVLPVEFRVEEYKRNNTTADVEAGTSYYDARIESLQKEIKRLRDSYGYAKREMSLFKERETTYTTEIQMLEAKLRDMRTEDFAKGRVNWASSDAHTFDTKSETEELAVYKTEDDIEMVNVSYNHFDIKGANGSHEMVEDLRNENLSLKEKVQKLQKDLENETNEAEESRSKIQKLKNENDSLEQKKQKLKQDLENVTTEADESHAKVSKLRRENDSLQANFQELEQETIAKAADELQYENESLKQELQKLRRDMKTARDVSEEALKRNDSEIDDLKQELQRDKNRNTCRASVDKDSSTSDIAELVQSDKSIEIKLRDEINTLKEELALRKKKVFHALEYDVTAIQLDSRANEVKKDVYQALQRELTPCNIDLKITTWEPRKLIGVSAEKVIFIPIVCYFVDTYKAKMKRALEDLEREAHTHTPPDIVVLVMYDLSSKLVCEELEKTVSKEFKSVRSIFKFGFHIYSSKQRILETNEQNFDALLQFMKGEGAKFLSR